MDLDTVLNHLTYGELSQIAIGGNQINCEDAKCISECDRDVLISNIQLGLTALYTRFCLLEREFELQLQPGINKYEIKSEYALSQNVDNPYIHDNEDFYDDRLIKIERIYDTQYKQIELNLRDDPCSIRTPNKNTIVLPPALWSYNEHEIPVPDNVVPLRQATLGSSGNDYGFPYGPDYVPTDGLSPYTGKPIKQSLIKATEGSQGLPTRLLSVNEYPVLNVVYRSDHHDIQTSGNTDIDLPESHLQALLYYVASRIMNPIGMTNEFHAGNSYYAKYEHEVNRLKIENLEIDNIGYDDRFNQKGFI